MNTKSNRHDRRLSSDVDAYVHEISQMPAIEFIGLTQVLRLSLKTDSGEPVDGQDLIEQSIAKFASLGRKQRREIIAALREARRQRKNDPITDTSASRGDADGPSA